MYVQYLSFIYVCIMYACMYLSYVCVYHVPHVPAGCVRACVVFVGVDFIFSTRSRAVRSVFV